MEASTATHREPRAERHIAFDLADQVAAAEAQAKQIQRAFAPQANQLIRQHAKAQQRRFTGAPLTDFGGLSA